VLSWSFVVGLVLLGDRAAAVQFDHLALSSNTRFARLYSGRIPSGVLVLGSSRAVNSFYAPLLTELLRRPVFNLGYNGLSAEVAEALLRDLLERNAKPELVVLEVTNVEFGNEVLNDFRPFGRFSPRIAAIIAQQDPRIAAATRISHLFSYNSEMFLRMLYSRHESDQTWVNRYRIAPAVLAGLDAAPPHTLSSNEAGLRALRRTLELLVSRGIEVRLVVGPYLPAYAQKIVNLRAWIARVEVDAGQPVWDFSSAVAEITGFADPRHLNEVGTSVFATQLLKARFFERGVHPPQQRAP
jgi:hypothetical protein